MATALTVAAGALSVTAPPGVPNPYMATEPNIPNLAELGIGSHGTTYNDNEKNVVFPFIAMPWADGHHRQIKNGDIVFISRHKEGMRHNIVELFKLNEILRQGWQLFLNTFGVRESLDSDDDEDDEERLPIHSMFRLDQDQSTDIRQTTLSSIKEKYLINANEDVLATETIPSAQDIFFKHTKSAQSVPEALANSSEATDLSLNDQLKQCLAELKTSSLYNNGTEEDKAFWRNLILQVEDPIQMSHENLLKLFVEYRSSVARYATLQGILSNWNLLGIVNNTSDGKSLQDLNNSVYPTVGNAPVFNVIMENHARTYNRWGDVKEQSHLGFVLTRRRLNPGSGWHESKWGEYQIVPWFTNDQERPPDSLLLHKDISSKDVIGHSWGLGKVDRRTTREAALNIRTMACGLIPHTGEEAPSLKEAYDAKAKLDMIEIFYKAL